MTCDANEDQNWNGAWSEPLVFYNVPRRRSTGLKVTLEEGLILNGWPTGFENPRRYIHNSGLRVYAPENRSGLTDGIHVISSANIRSGSIASIDIKSRARGNVPIVVDILSGILSVAGGRGVKVDAELGDVTVNLAGTSTIRDLFGLRTDPAHSGIEVYRTHSSSGDTTVALKGQAKIVSKDKGGVDRGVYIHDESAPESSGTANIRVTTEKDTRIGSADRALNMDGIHVLIQYNNEETMLVKDVTVEHKGRIYAKTNGIKIEHGGSGVPANNNGGQGTATVTISESGVVETKLMDSFAIHLNTPDEVSDRREQSVTVNGRVVGGKNGGAIKLEGGGTITLEPNAILRPDGASDSYTEITVMNPSSAAKNLVINMDLSIGDDTLRKYRNFYINNGANGNTKTEFKYRTTATDPYDLTLTPGNPTSVAKGLKVTGLLCGFYNDCESAEDITATVTTPINNKFAVQFTSVLGAKRTAPEGTRTVNVRGRNYEALPSVLWDMTGSMETYRPAMMVSAPGASAASTIQVAQSDMMAGSGMAADRQGWGHIDGNQVERRLRISLAKNLSYKLSHGGFAAGVDLVEENGMIYRVGLHRRQGKARVSDGGQVTVAGTGAGVGMTRSLGAGLSVQGWLGVTRFDDIKVTSTEMVNEQSIEVNAKTKGTGYILALGVAKRMVLENLALTQRGDLTWSSVSMKDFMTEHQITRQSSVASSSAMTVTETVKVKKDSGLTGRYGVMLEGEYEDASGACCRLFGSLDLEHDFHAKRQAMVSGEGFSTSAMSEIKPTLMRLGFGGSKSWNNGESEISGAVYHTTAGSGNNTLSGGIAVSFKF